MKLRESNLEKLDSRVFDVLIVGAGINGAVSASALATQGARVALIDMGDFASATSQESSNLVWGGIKYLEGGEVGLVRKLCLSRNRLLRAYPSSIREIRFFTSIERGFRWPRFFIYLGTLLYWAIGNFFTRAPRLLSRDDIADEEPSVALLGPGGVEYSDAFLVDNDTRFVFGFVRNALDHGAIAVNYVRSIGSERGEDGMWQTRVRDELTGIERIVRSRVLINAAGPYVDAHNTLTGQTTAYHHVFSKGVHLIVDRITPVRRVLTFFADDGRLFFVIPLGPKSCIGTTDTRVDNLPARVEPEDRRFILENVNRRLRLARPLTERDIIAERVGVRPLVLSSAASGDGRDWLALSRKHVVEVDADDRHISIFGGKLTDCLNIGEEIALAVRALGIDMLDYGHRWYGEPDDSMREVFFHQAKLMGLDAMTAKDSVEPLSTRLWRRYGATALGLLDDIRQEPRMAQVLIAGTEYIRCELYHAAQREMVTKLEDFLRRRSKIALIARREEIRKAPGLMEACEILFGDEAQAKFDEYFADDEPAATLTAS
ncbi:MAG TPA: FAD-dependent oxidoreductase [Polyangiales bacterium]|nr:FAD-dependent oxidoreductase [Polyangiales bacterium]